MQKRLLILIFSFLFHVFFIAAQENVLGTGSAPVFDNSTEIVKIVIFPYSSPDPQVVASYNYALFTVPDLLQEKLEGSGRFAILDLPSEVRQQGSGTDSDMYRLETARQKGSDYFIWGYILGTEQGLKVIHKVMDSHDGLTIKVESQDLPLGSSLINAMEESTVSFSEGLSGILVPSPAPSQVQVVEKVVERIVEVPVDSGKFRKKSNLEASLGLTGYTGNYEEQLAGAFFLKLDLTYPLDVKDHFDWGADISVTTITKSEKAELTEAEIPELVYLPMLLKTAARWHIFPFLDLGWELKAGASLFMGEYGGKSVFLLRPSWATGAMMELWPGENLSLRFHLDYLGTWLSPLDYGSTYLPSLRMGLGLAFDI